ncbi:hypothetical protein SLA2020_507770 [Shorea laevis]
MENACKEPEPGSSSTGIFELPGEPAVVINGVPEASPSFNVLALSDVKIDAESHEDTGCGEWLEGRRVQKLFGEQYYTGTVTDFDKETGWYRVVYDDGDLEDLDWGELEQVLLPVDINVPLKGLALKLIKKDQKTVHKSGQKMVRSGIQEAKHAARKMKKIELNEKV